MLAEFVSIGTGSRSRNRRDLDYVGRRSRNRGVGTALLQSAVLSASHLGKRVLFGILLERNQASIRLMQKCGFELWGRLPDVALIDGVLVSHFYYGRRV